ncbi:hypothetical protein [Clostridium tertium]|uniref:hypothetical protein n=1 Tax=Clostridium tertium TaxID=1559 RepID=UPI000DD0E3D3|nr:hypothetical protein [Clostridium tertium]
MEIINLATRKEVEVLLNGKECIVSFTVKNIRHFQETNNLGIQVALEKMENGDLEMILKLIYSMVSDKKTGRVLGQKFFKDYDDIDIIQAISPVITKVINKEMPEAKSESEKK